MRPRGFTLLELLVVLVMISVLLAVAAPRLAGRAPAAALGNAAREVQALAASARARAVLGGQPVGLLLGADGQELGLVAGDGDSQASPVDLVPRRRLPSQVRARFMPEGEGDTGLIRFQPDGSADGGELTLVHARGESLTLELLAPLGSFRQSLQRGPAP